jgi:hypothetical protein
MHFPQKLLFLQASKIHQAIFKDVKLKLYLFADFRYRGDYHFIAGYYLTLANRLCHYLSSKLFFLKVK